MRNLPPHIRPSFARFVEGPSAVNEAVRGLGAGGLNRRPHGDDWSARDVIIHLADSELVAAVRFRLVIAEEAPLLPAYDEGNWKRRLHYLWRSPEAALSLFQQTRFSSAEMLRQCSAPAWERTGLHPTFGVLTLEALLARGVDHIDQHVAQLAALRSPA
ncbi:MAG: DinB family protein [Tepidiformaceae bacterium]